MIDLDCIYLIARRALLLGSLLIASSFTLWAQADGPDGPPPDGPPPGMQDDVPRARSVDREFRQLVQLLTLTDAQQTQVKTLLAEQRQQIVDLHKALQNDSGQDPRASRDKVEAIRDATETKIAALLDDAQKPKFADWQQKRKAAVERRRRQDDQPPPPPPDGGGGPPPNL
jgi:hypothetical protein